MLLDHWQILHTQAKKAQQAEIEWTSFIEKRRYRFMAVEDDRIIIQRISGGNDAIISKKSANTAIERLRIAGRLPKTQLFPSVVGETTLIFLYPAIHWDYKNREIYWKDADNLEKALAFVEDAEDDQLEKILVAINKRRNQSKFRKALLALYGHKCAISGTNIEQLLEAAHISIHAKSGINSSNNGILLRKDLHRLFDCNLLRIHPKTLTVHIDKTITDPQYTQLKNRVISLPLNGSRPSELYLQKKWDEGVRS